VRFPGRSCGGSDVFIDGDIVVVEPDRASSALDCIRMAPNQCREVHEAHAIWVVVGDGRAIEDVIEHLGSR
jgi:hypothetical protein